jgi:hypothetical protein
MKLLKLSFLVLNPSNSLPPCWETNRLVPSGGKYFLKICFEKEGNLKKMEDR